MNPGITILAWLEWGVGMITPLDGIAHIFLFTTNMFLFIALWVVLDEAKRSALTGDKDGR